MKRRAAWCALVFLLTLLSQWPARWIVEPLALPMTGVSGSLWHGQAERLAEIDRPVWHLQPWRLRADISGGWQGQRWNLAMHGWPWAWQVQVQPGERYVGGAGSYRLAGQWQGRIALHGHATQCQRAEGQVSAASLELQAPWQLPLGQASLRLDCSNGVKLLASLQLADQHQAELEADIGGRRAKLEGSVEAGAAIYPVLVSAQWLTPGNTRLARNIRW